MRTVQEYLKEVDLDQLYEKYEERYGTFRNVDFMNVPWNLVDTINAYSDKEKTAFIRYVRNLLTITPCASDSPNILIAYPGIEEDDDMLGVLSDMFVLSDVLYGDLNKITPYAYEFTEQKEIMGFLVADTPYTQHHILEVLADVLHEASWFGYKQEGLEEAKNDLDKSVEDVKAGRVHTLNMDEVFPSDIVEESREQDRELGEEGKKLYYDYIKSQSDVNRYSMLMQIKKVREMEK